MNLLKFFRWKYGLVVYLILVISISYLIAPPFYISVLIAIAAFIFPGYIFSTPKYKGRVSDHFDGKKFFNPSGIHEEGFAALMKWIFNRKRGEWKISSRYSLGEKPSDRISSGVKTTFINHSSFLIQLDRLNLLIDPVWSERVSPIDGMGPRRMRSPGIRFEDLPIIDAVLLTHNHYDHLDLPTMEMLNEKFHPKIITTLGGSKFLEKNKITGAKELDWWDETQLSEQLKLIAVPAQHFSGRGTFDRNTTLWCGFIIQRSKGNIYIAGDTGYNDSTFNEIGNRFGPISVSIIPVGAYRPQWFMSPIHVSPMEAVKIHLEVKSQKSIACHFGTFPLVDEGNEELITDFRSALKQSNVSEENFLLLKEGTGVLLED